jgi:diketogulonate reductase-like aldo/keto reductase
MTNPLTIRAHGAAIPAVGLGTWLLRDEACERAVATAIEAGYRHIDTATLYGNEAAVGRGIKASGIARDALWLTTKVQRDEIGAGALQRSAERSLEALGVAAVDLLLIHWPNEAIPLADSIGALCDAKRRGFTRHIGVSNFPTAMMREAVRLASEPILTNQVEYHPRLDQSKVIAVARELGVLVTAYCPLGRGDVGGVLGEPAIAEIARGKGRTPAQVILRWHYQQGIVTVPKSATPSRIRENLDIAGFELTAGEMQALSQLARPDGRIVNLAFAPKWD